MEKKSQTLLAHGDISHEVTVRKGFFCKTLQQV